MLLASLFAPMPKATQRVLEFFTTKINNDHTRKSYLFKRDEALCCPVRDAWPCTSSPTCSLIGGKNQITMPP
jgi:hypothetical protein